MTVGLIIIALFGLIAVLTHRRTRFEERVFKNVPINDWFILAGYPAMLFIGWALLIRNIINRPSIGLLPIDDIDFLLVMLIFLVYAFVGNSVHFISKIVWRYLVTEHKNSMAYKVNEMFHGQLSHYLIYTTTLIVIFLISLLELNHPTLYPFSSGFRVVALITGIVFGYSCAKSIFYTNQWFGGYNKPLSFLAMFLLAVMLSFFILLDINIYYYPVSFFIITSFGSFIGAFILRQVVIFSRLSGKLKGRFIHRLLSG